MAKVVHRKVGRKVAALHPPGSNVGQNQHPSKHVGRQWGKTMGLHKAVGFDRASAAPRV